MINPLATAVLLADLDVVELIGIFLAILGAVAYVLYEVLHIVFGWWVIKDIQFEKRPFYRRGQWSRGVGYQDRDDESADREP